MKGLEFLGICLLVIDNELFSVIIQFPKLSEESVHAVDALRIPWLGLLDRTEEHLIKPQSISTIRITDIIRIDDIVHRLAHLLDSPSADVLAVFEHKLSIGKLRSPLSECVNVKTVVLHDIDIDVNLSRLILVPEACGNELVGSHDTIYEIRTPLDHTLVHKFSERLILAYITHVIEELVPEAGVDEMACSMLSTTDIEVNVPPVLVSLDTYEVLIVVRIHVPEIVCAGTRETRHCTGLERTALVCPVLGTCKRRLAAFSRLELVDFRKSERKFLVRKRCRNTFLVIYRERFAPISLTRENGITQPVVHFTVADSLSLNIFHSGRNSLLHIHSVEESGVAHLALFGVEAVLAHVAAFNDRNDRKAEFLRECIVAAVMCRNCHDGTCAVTGKDIF